MSHYVINIEVKRVEHVKRRPGGLNMAGETTERVVTDLSHVVVKGKDLNNAVAKATAHLDLIEDDTEGEQ